jgi:hypothetical protein
MALFIIFVFGAVVLGAGAMLAPAWPSVQPRIGLAAAFALAIIIGGAVFWSMLFGWSTLVVDYLLFALIIAIILGGTLAHAQMRAEAKGEVLADADQGWPGPQDLAFFGLVALICILPVLILPVPLDTDAQGFGYLALMTRLGGTFNTLAPFHPEITYLYAPGLSAITAYLSQQLGQSIPTVQFSLAAVCVFLCEVLAYDFGAELRDKRLGRTMALAMFGGLGLFLAFLDSHFTTLLALVFALAFLIYAFRYLRHPHRMDALAAGLMLGAAVLCHPDVTIILALGYVPWLLTMWLGKPRPTLKTWLVLALGVPLVALAGIAPWLLRERALLGSTIVSPFLRDPGYWRVMVLYHGVWIVPVALIGAVVALRRRKADAPADLTQQAAILAVGWLLMVLDFSTTGVLESLLPGIVAPLTRYDYPFSVAWHGPIIPYTILGGIGLWWLWEKYGERRFGVWLARRAAVLIGVVAGLVLLVALLNRPLLAFSKDKVSFFGAFASQADVAAMMWLRDNTPADARVLNFPGPQEGDWVAVIAERDAVYYRWQPFFRGDDTSRAEQDRLRAFWEDPANSQNAQVLRDAHITYVIVPQVVGNPASFAGMFRWRRPFSDDLPMRSAVSNAPYLEKVFDDDGAQVYRVKASP